MTAFEFMTDESFEQEIELRRRLLPYVAKYLNEDAIHTASDAVSDLLSDVPEFAEDLLSLLSEWCEFFPNQIAKDVLGIQPDRSCTTEELLKRFEILESGQDEQSPVKTRWLEEVF